MKLFKKISILTVTLIAAGVTSCKKILVENPRANITPQFFTTPGGVLGGIIGIYGDMRNLWGTEGFTNITLAGTDEYLAGGSATSSTIPFFTYTNLVGNVAAYNAVSIFGVAYQDINTANGVLQYGPSAFPDALTRTEYLAQAKFLRALYYFYLVQTFGPVPLHTTFISTPTTSDSRAPIANVYAQIITDLTQASTELQTIPGETISSTGAVSPFAGKAATRATALYLLSKVYLTRGWSSAAQPNDFAMALSTAQSLITNAATYKVGLWQDFASANAPGNEYGQETLFVVDESNSTKYGNYVAGGAGGSYNITSNLFRPNYPTVNANYPATGGANVMTRDIANGRPFIRIRPNPAYVIEQAFADKVNDSRYYKTFQTVWIANTAGVTTPRGTLTVGADTAIWMPPFDPGATKRAAFKGIILTPPEDNAPNPYTTVFFPSMKKYDDPNRTGVNDPSTRPFILFRFADVYMVAAEAAFKSGDLTTAAAMINVIRTRAAYQSTNSGPQNTAAATAMQITPSQVTLDFILDERSREFFGECQRWYDLVRTQSIVRRVQQYNAEAGPNIQNFEDLRPIPQTEIDLVTTGPKFPQNPGY
ncbi:Starch-binding associating with outer membrane [Mucilaginibacter mallensis]|uniref:Starch-binding associating with outer membrane n=1 Tax=Mucilaginibacter mallensis TaxID=652787 RepID=A0A1H1Y1M8_MUCMA|nr:RagB/SusD family nutrient uptake outer membrane protein [Mucilaginibacter mallensis]SDT15384.1 Starch-binding associating with outer membrane [Mucilaginibacter mallensis]